MSLLSLVLTLRPLAVGNPAEGFARAAHAALLEAVQAQDAALAATLHAGSEMRPFTVSNVIGFSPKQGVEPEGAYTLRFTALTAPLAQVMRAATQPGGPLARGATLPLAGVQFGVEAAATTAQEQPWAGASDYETLSAPWLLARQTPAKRLALRFASPTTFKSGGKHVPVPLPSLVFHSLKEKWNAFAPVALPEEVTRYAEECLALSGYELRTQPVTSKAGGLRMGAVGTAHYTALNPDRYWLSVLNLLADFAFFAGVGAGTTMGLGQVKRITDV